MASVEEHIKTILALERDILEKVRANRIAEQQKIIGFATSEASVNCFAVFLHKKQLLPIGSSVNHRWFKSEKIANEHFPFDFPKKTILFDKLLAEEEFRDKLCYGKNKPEELAQKAVKTFFEIKETVEAEVGKLEE